MLILGCVKKIQDYQLIVSLPNGNHGIVSIANISDAYTSLLHKLSEGDAFTEVIAKVLYQFLILSLFIYNFGNYFI